MRLNNELELSFRFHRNGKNSRMKQKRGVTMKHGVIRAACALIIVFLVVAAFYLANVVFEPVAFALFAIAIVWPLQKALKAWMPGGIALIITIVVTLVVVIK